MLALSIILPLLDYSALDVTRFNSLCSHSGERSVSVTEVAVKDPLVIFSSCQSASLRLESAWKKGRKSECSRISLKYGASRWQDCREMDRLVRNGAWKPFLRHRDTCIASIICFLHTLKRHTLNVEFYTTIIEFRLGANGNSLHNDDRSVSTFFARKNQYSLVSKVEPGNLYFQETLRKASSNFKSSAFWKLQEA